MPTSSGAGASSPEHLVVGHIARAHGTRGELFVWPLTDHADAVFAAGRALLLGDEEGALDEGAPFVVVEHARAFKQGLLVAFEGVPDRTAAETLARRYLLLHVSEAPPREEGEVFYHELLGCAVETVSGERVGTVTEVFETEPHHLLQVRGEDGRERLIPFAERIVRDVDAEGRRLVIDPPAGLLDL